MFFRNLNGRSSFRISTGPRVSAAQAKNAESAQLNAIPTSQCARNFVKHRLDNSLKIAVVKMRVGPGHTADQLRFRHWLPPIETLFPRKRNHALPTGTGQTFWRL